MSFWNAIKDAFESGAVKDLADVYYTNKARTAEDEDERESAQRALMVGSFFDSMNTYRKNKKLDTQADQYSGAITEAYNQQYGSGEEQVEALINTRNEKIAEAREKYSGKEQEYVLGQIGKTFNQAYGDTTKKMQVEAAQATARNNQMKLFKRKIESQADLNFQKDIEKINELDIPEEEKMQRQKKSAQRWAAQHEDSSKAEKGYLDLLAKRAKVITPITRGSSFMDKKVSDMTGAEKLAYNKELAKIKKVSNMSGGSAIKWADVSSEANNIIKTLSGNKQKDEMDKLATRIFLQDTSQKPEDVYKKIEVLSNYEYPRSRRKATTDKLLEFEEQLDEIQQEDLRQKGKIRTAEATKLQTYKKKIDTGETAFKDKAELEVVQKNLGDLKKAYDEIPSYLKGAAAGRTWGKITAEMGYGDAGVKANAFNSKLEIMLAPLSKTVGGQKGALSDRDIEQARNGVFNLIKNQATGDMIAEYLDDFISNKLNKYDELISRGEEAVKESQEGGKNKVIPTSTLKRALKIAKNQGDSAKIKIIQDEINKRELEA